MSLSRLKSKFEVNFRVNFHQVLKKFTNSNNHKITLGRWSNENIKKTNLKIDYANEDHCGVCTGILHNKKK
jgi:hypothetical protein